MDAFSAGQVIGVRLPPSKTVKAQLALLEVAAEEIWEFRIRDTAPQLRVFGRFAEQDLFIALTHAGRDGLETDEDWRREKRRCTREWRRLFPSYNPHTGQTADDYLSNSFSP